MQAVGFLGVDVEAHAGRFRQLRKGRDARNQRFHHAFLLGAFIAGKQGRELNRDAGVRPDVVGCAGARNLGNRLGIGHLVATRVTVGQGRFPQHIVGIGKALFLHLGPTFHRRPDGFAQHELAAHFLHGAADGGADDGFAKAFDRSAQCTCDARLAVFQDLPGQQQCPGRCVHQRRGRAPKVFTPVRRRDLVFDQCVDGFRIRHAQKRFGQTHQRDAFVSGQAVFGQKDLHQAGIRAFADAPHQLRPAGRNPRAICVRQIGCVH